MAKSRNDFEVTKEKIKQVPKVDENFIIMKRGYKEMAAINLALSNLYFEVESEAQNYYDRIAECE